MLFIGKLMGDVETGKDSSARSFSRVPFVLKVAGKGEVKGELIKHLAPFTNRQIIKRGKVEGVITKEGDMIVLMAGITAGLEKAKRSFKEGDVTLLPLDGSMRFILKDQDVSRPMNHIGQVKEGMETLRRLGPGDTAQLLVSVGFQARE